MRDATWLRSAFTSPSRFWIPTSVCCQRGIRCDTDVMHPLSVSTRLALTNVSVREWIKWKLYRILWTKAFGPHWLVRNEDPGSAPLTRRAALLALRWRRRTAVALIESTQEEMPPPVAPTFAVPGIRAATTKTPALRLRHALAKLRRRSIPTTSASAPPVSWGMVTSADLVMRNPNQRSSLMERLRRS